MAVSSNMNNYHAEGMQSMNGPPPPEQHSPLPSLPYLNLSSRAVGAGGPVPRGAGGHAARARDSGALLHNATCATKQTAGDLEL